MSKNSNTDSDYDSNQVQNNNAKTVSPVAQRALQEAQARKKANKLSKEFNGPKGLEPTRYGDWEAKGRCYDF